MIEPKPDRHDDLTRAIAGQVRDIHHTAELVRTAADGDSLSTLDRAGVLVALAEIRERLNSLFDQLWDGAGPEGVR
jgi:hypothetical protein